VPVVVDERVVDEVAAGQPDERDLRRLRADRQDDGDGKADPVGTEEAEQTHERRPIRDGTHIRQGIGVVTADDGSPVELYALLPDRGEGEIVAAAVQPPATVLELGCGTGRMTRQLVALGFSVTAVDESAAMLAHVRDAETVQARIEGIDLGRRFDAALLASNLMSTESAQRQAFLESCCRHADLVVIETLPLGWTPKEGSAALGDVTTSTHVGRFEAGVVHGFVEYEARGKTWTHEFAMRVFADQPELDETLAEGGLRFDRWLDRDRGWFVATAASVRP
jgi:SAM-dependent methyltransferase